MDLWEDLGTAKEMGKEAKKEVKEVRRAHLVDHRLTSA